MQVLYTASATATGGRAGHVRSSEGALDFDLAWPKELGGAGGAGTNPEELFAAGYAACFAQALVRAARDRGVVLRRPALGDGAEVGVGRLENGRLNLAVGLRASLPGVERAQAEALVAMAHEEIFAPTRARRAVTSRCGPRWDRGGGLRIRGAAGPAREGIRWTARPSCWCTAPGTGAESGGPSPSGCERGGTVSSRRRTPAWPSGGTCSRARSRIETFVDDVALLLEAEELEDVVLVGHSFGGNTISGVADRMPERIRRLVYLDAMVLEGGVKFVRRPAPGGCGAAALRDRGARGRGSAAGAAGRGLRRAAGAGARLVLPAPDAAPGRHLRGHAAAAEPARQRAAAHLRRLHRSTQRPARVQPALGARARGLGLGRARDQPQRHGPRAGAGSAAAEETA